MKRKRFAVVTGFPYYAKFLAELMNECSEHWHMRAYGSARWQTLSAIFAMKHADVLICFGGPAPDAGLLAAARKHNVQVVVVWAGSDVIRAQSDPQDLQAVKSEGFHHISDGSWLVDELAVLGLHAEYEPLTAVRPGEPVKPLPKQFRVLTYLPEPRRDFYGAPLVYEIARRLPDVPFVVVGNGQRAGEAPPNVEFRGYVSNMQDLIDDSTVLLRLPQHDGKSMLVLEVLARARHVVWNYDFPYVHTADSLESALEHVQKLRDAHLSGELQLNVEAREYVLERFGRRETAARLEARLDRIRGEQKLPRFGSRRRVAISGLRLFCADVATYAKISAPEWDVRLLRTNSRLEILTSIIALFDCDVWYLIGNPVNNRILAFASRLMRKPRVIHWVGSDILTLGERPELAAKLTSRSYLHLSEAPWTAQELQRYGLTASIVPLPPRHHHGTTQPLPQAFTVMLYVPRTRSEFYGRSAFERLMQTLRGKPIRYVIVGGGTLDVPEGVDVTNLGWRNDLTDAYRQTSVLVRFTPHDGLSLMVLEALSYGRHVIWTQPFPFVRQVATYEDIEREILDLLHAHERGELRPQQNASEDINRHYSPERCIKRLAQAWDDAANWHAQDALAPETP